MRHGRSIHASSSTLPFLTVSCVKSRGPIPMKHGLATGCAIEIVQTVQTNRPNSSGLTAHQCPWLRPGHRPNNGCSRKAVDSESQPAACHGARLPASGTFECRGAGRAANAPLRDSLQRAKSASYIFIRIAPHQAPIRALTRAARRGARRDAVKPMTGTETRPIAPTSPSDGRDVNSKKIQFGDGRWNEALSACAANP